MGSHASTGFSTSTSRTTASAFGDGVPAAPTAETASRTAGVGAAATRRRRPVSPDLAVPAGMAAHRFRAMGTDVVALLTGRPCARRRPRSSRTSSPTGRPSLSRFLPGERALAPERTSGIDRRGRARSCSRSWRPRSGQRARHGDSSIRALHDHLVRIGYDRPFEQVQSVVAAGDGRAAGEGGWRDHRRRSEDASTVPPAARAALSISEGSRRGWPSTPRSTGSPRRARRGRRSSARAVISRSPARRRERAPGPFSSVTIRQVAVGRDSLAARLRRPARRGGPGSRAPIPRHHLIDPRTGEPAASGLSPGDRRRLDVPRGRGRGDSRVRRRTRSRVVAARTSSASPGLSSRPPAGGLPSAAGRSPDLASVA